jgi:hypothetical protein
VLDLTGSASETGIARELLEGWQAFTHVTIVVFAVPAVRNYRLPAAAIAAS